MFPELFSRLQKRKRAELLVVQPGHSIDLKAALVFPSPYAVGTANLGFQFIYAALNRMHGVQCHRFYLPDPDLEYLFEEGREVMRSFETEELLSDYDIAAFSLSYEIDIPNILKILKYAGIPVRSEDRTDVHPLIVGGGVVVTANPEPLADFLDAAVIGEGEEVIAELVSALISSWSGNRDKKECLRLLSKIPGLYIPSFFNAIYGPDYTFQGLFSRSDGAPPRLLRRIIPELDRIGGQSIIQSPEIEFPDLHLVEVSRGCPGHCRFCVVHQCYHPFRIRSAESISGMIPRVDPDLRIGLLGAGIGHHPQLKQICSGLIRSGRKISFSSIDVSHFDEEFRDIIESAGVETITLAPEAGLDSRRKSIGKDLRTEDFLQAIELLPSPPVKYIKLYFMIGLPGETQEDLDFIVHFAKKAVHIRKSMDRKSPPGKIVGISVSCFVPKPNTPFERAPMADEQDLKSKIYYLRNQIKKTREAHLTHDSPKWAVIQGLLARGDRRTGEIIRMVALKGLSWRAAFRQIPMNPDYYMHRKIPIRETLPWSHMRCDYFSSIGMNFP